VRTVREHGATPLLADALPALAEELVTLLRRVGREDLANQIASLRLSSRCRCGDGFCATIDTGAGPPADSIDLEPAGGMMIADVDGDDHIVGIEILDRPEYKKALDGVFSLAG